MAQKNQTALRAFLKKAAKGPKKSSQKPKLKISKKAPLKTVPKKTQTEDSFLQIQKDPEQTTPTISKSLLTEAETHQETFTISKSLLAQKEPDLKPKLTKPKLTKTKAKTAYEKDNPLTRVFSKQFQMMKLKSNHAKNSNSPLQMHLIQSESLRVAQDKIKELEEELMKLRKHNESILSASEILKANNVSLKQDLENTEHKFNEQKKSFKEEKEVLMSALSSAKENLDKLKSKNKELDKKMSGYFYNLRNRESSLEGRIEILKMENSILQREKDNKILQFKKDIENNKYKIDNLHKENQELKSLLRKLRESSSRAVSALRATVFNLEGAKEPDNTIFTKDDVSKK